MCEKRLFMMIIFMLLEIHVMWEGTMQKVNRVKNVNNLKMGGQKVHDFIDTLKKIKGIFDTTILNLGG